MFIHELSSISDFQFSDLKFSKSFSKSHEISVAEKIESKKLFFLALFFML
jgi:hypothetical protein